jgi:catechol 2,3-dioxygenase-like lactoylglutathione lyase family enzyme
MTATKPEPEPASGLGPIGQLSLLVRDIEQASAFYRDVLGLPHLYTFGPLAFFDCAGTRLFLSVPVDGAWRPSSVIYFRVQDIRATHERLAAAGVAFAGAPHLMHRHDSGVEEWMAFFADPDGNTLALLAQVPPPPR